MRPCPRCGAAIGNKAACCPRCAGKPLECVLAPCRIVADPGSELDADPFEDENTDVTLVLGAFATVLSLPLALCYLAFGAAGLVGGVMVGAAVFVLFWSAMGGAC